MTPHGGTGGRGGSWPSLARDGPFMIHKAIHNMWITVWETRQRQRVERITPITITPKPIRRFQLLSPVRTGTVVLVLAVT